MTKKQLLQGLDAFGEDVEASLRNLPQNQFGHEHDIHFCLAYALQRAWNLPLGSLVFEQHMTDGGSIDIWVHKKSLAIEVKYLRGEDRPKTYNFGRLLCDLNRLGRFKAKSKLVVCFTDDKATKYLRKRGEGVLPLKVGQSIQLSEEIIDALPQTAVKAATQVGEWIPQKVKLVWFHQCCGYDVFAWSCAVA